MSEVGTRHQQVCTWSWIVLCFVILCEAQAPSPMDSLIRVLAYSFLTPSLTTPHCPPSRRTDWNLSSSIVVVGDRKAPEGRQTAENIRLGAVGSNSKQQRRQAQRQQQAAAATTTSTTHSTATAAIYDNNVGNTRHTIILCSRSISLKKVYPVSLAKCIHTHRQVVSHVAFMLHNAACYSLCTQRAIV